MLSSYRALFRRAGARPLALACGLAWLSFGGYTFAIIVAVHAATRSFSVAGGVVAAFSVGSGLAAPARGRFIDRHGPSSLAVFGAAHGCCAAVLVAGCALGAGPPVLLGAGAVAGVCAPPLIATARSVWGQLAGKLAPTAHALNAALADVGQLLAPAVVGALTALLSSSAALGVLVAGATTASVLTARAGRGVCVTRASRRVAHGVWGALDESAGLRTLVICDVLVGAWAGAFEVAATAVAAHSGAAALGAVPLCASAAGGVLVSLWAGTGRLRRSPAWRYLAGCLLVAAVLPFTLLVRSVAGLAVIAVPVGVGYASLNLSVFELLDHVVAADRAVEAFTWLTTAAAAGAAIGAAGAGQLGRTGGVAPLLLTACFAAVVALVACLRRRTLQGRT